MSELHSFAFAFFSSLSLSIWHVLSVHSFFSVVFAHTYICHFENKCNTNKSTSTTTTTTTITKIQKDNENMTNQIMQIKNKKNMKEKRTNERKKVRN